MGHDSQSKDPRPAGVLDKGTLVVILQILFLVIICHNVSLFFRDDAINSFQLKFSDHGPC